jgi:hypothetical protein
MPIVYGRLEDIPKCVVAALAVLFSFAPVVAILQSLGWGSFRQAFGEWRFLYFFLPPAIIAIVIYFGVINHWSSRALFALSVVAGYVGSLMTYICLAMPSLVSSVGAGRWELFFMVPILPIHIIFILGAGGGTLLMIGFLALYKSWYSGP